MKRGEESLERLKSLALYKLSLEKNVKKGWPGINQIRQQLILLKREVEELEEAIFKHVVAPNDYLEQIAYPTVHGRREIELECADVAAFCAIILDSVSGGHNEGDTGV